MIHFPKNALGTFRNEARAYLKSEPPAGYSYKIVFHLTPSLVNTPSVSAH